MDKEKYANIAYSIECIFSICMQSIFYLVIILLFISISIWGIREALNFLEVLNYG